MREISCNKNECDPNVEYCLWHKLCWLYGLVGTFSQFDGRTPINSLAFKTIICEFPWNAQRAVDFIFNKRLALIQVYRQYLCLKIIFWAVYSNKLITTNPIWFYYRFRNYRYEQTLKLIKNQYFSSSSAVERMKAR